MPRPPASLLDHVRESLQRAGVRVDDVLVVGLSGGVDSLTLTHALVTLSDLGQGPRIQALHVDHQLRPGSGADAERVERLASDLRVPIDIARVNVQAWGQEHGQGIEAAARAARYAALARAAIARDTTWIVLGHTLDDQVETVILRLARGTSLDGLAGMRENSTRAIRLDPDRDERFSANLLRPQLTRRRVEIEAYAAEHGLTPVEDETNADPRFRRNAVRHQVVPLLERIVPGAASSIARAAELLAGDAALLSALAQDASDSVVDQVGPCLRLSRETLRRLNASLQRRVIVTALQRLCDDVVLTNERVEALRQATLGGHVSAVIEIGNGLAAYVDYDHLVVGPAERIEPTLRDHANVPLIHAGSAVPLVVGETIQLGDRWDLSVSATGPLAGWQLRTRQPGDRLALDSSTQRRLQDWFVNRRVPGYLRDYLPLLVHEGLIRWVAGISSVLFDDVDSGVTARLSERSVEAHEHGQRDPRYPSA